MTASSRETCSRPICGVWVSSPEQPWGVSRLARSAYVRRLLTGKLPPVLFAYPGCLSLWRIRLFLLRFPSIYITFPVTRSGSSQLG